MKHFISSGYCFALFSALCFSFKAILVKIAYTYGIDPLSLCLLRMLVSLPLFLLTLGLFEGKRGFVVSGKEAFRFMVMGTLLGCAMLFSLYSIALLDASVATILAYIYPTLIVVFLFILFKDQISIPQIFSLIITLLGLVLVLNKSGSDFQSVNMQGVAWGILTAICYALYSIMTEKAIKVHSAIKSSTFSILFMVTLFTLFSWGRIEYHLVPELVKIIVVLGVCTGFIPFLLFTLAIKRMGAARSSILSLTGPVFTVLWAYSFLGEILNNTQLLGVILVLLGVSVVKRKSFGKISDVQVLPSSKMNK